MTKSPLLRAMVASAMSSMAMPMLRDPGLVIATPNEDKMRWGHFDHSNGTVEAYDPTPKKPRKNKAQRQARRAQRKK